MNWYQNLKQAALRPVLVQLDRAGIRPNHVTWLALIFGLAFCPLYLLDGGPAVTLLAYALLALHLIIDGVDGPLARHQAVASSAGSYTDTLADQTVIALTTMTYMQAELLDRPGLGIFSGGCYLFLYTVVVATAMVRNGLGIPYRFLWRPRMLVYLLLFVEWAAPADWRMSWVAEICVWAFNTLLAVSFLSGYRALRGRIA
jgi:phosphatidylglycerophosphate synthase